MVAADLCFGDGVLEAVEIEQLAVTVDNVADEGVLESVDLCDVGDRAAGVAGSVDYFYVDALPCDFVAIRLFVGNLAYDIELFFLYERFLLLHIYDQIP